jgi:hypothetical protein
VVSAGVHSEVRTERHMRRIGAIKPLSRIRW